MLGSVQAISSMSPSHKIYTQGIKMRHIQENDREHAHKATSSQNCSLSMSPIPLTNSLEHSVGKSKLTGLNWITHFDLDKNDYFFLMVPMVRT